MIRKDRDKRYGYNYTNYVFLLRLSYIFFFNQDQNRKKPEEKNSYRETTSSNNPWLDW